MAGQVFPDFVATVPGLLRAGAERHPDRDCVVTPTERLSYGELDARSRRLSARLVTAGVTKSSRVGVLFPNGVPWVLAWAAVARVGAVVIPVNTFYKPAELGRFLRHADVQILVGVDSFISHDYLERLETVAPELIGHGAGPLWLPTLRQLRRVLLWGPSTRPWAAGGLGDGLDGRDVGGLDVGGLDVGGLDVGGLDVGGLDVGGLDVSGPPAPVDGVVRGLEADVTPGDQMLVTYTSGSTGEPKGVVHSHGALVRHARNLAALSGVDAMSRIWTPMPLCWVGGFAFTLLRALCVGGAFVTQEVFDVGEALRLLERERVTIVSAWPAACRSLADHLDYPSTDLSAVVAGSFYEALPADRRPPDPGLVIGSLGMSETCGPHTFWTAAEEPIGAPERHRGTFGHEVPGTEHRIVDPETGCDVADGEEGEVLVRGYSLMLGLYKRERNEVFDGDGWYHTGDRGCFRDGWFFFTGRQSDLIKTAGSNVAPAEVEACLLAADGVKLAFVVGTPHPDRGEDVVGLVVPWRAGEGAPSRASVDVDELREGLRAQLSSYKVPRHVLVIADGDVPWLASQKADRRALATLATRLIGERQETARG